MAAMPLVGLEPIREHFPAAWVAGVERGEPPDYRDWGRPPYFRHTRHLEQPSRPDATATLTVYGGNVWCFCHMIVNDGGFVAVSFADGGQKSFWTKIKETRDGQTKTDDILVFPTSKAHSVRHCRGDLSQRRRYSHDRDSDCVWTTARLTALDLLNCHEVRTEVGCRFDLDSR